MPSNVAFKAMNLLHQSVLKLSAGRVGWGAAGMPVLQLTTTGRKTGQPRSVMLTSPLQQGTTLVVVASRGGDDTHPAWYLNLLANPEVEVTMKGRLKQRMHARVASPEERARLWPQVTTAHKNYAGYQTKTEREIPLVLIEPAS